jgi:predicted lipid-binding transport protein (Tim44 family)
MDVHFIDIIFFAMVAAFLILRLRSVLGRRTGDERPRPDPFHPDPAEGGADKIIPLPGPPERAAGEPITAPPAATGTPIEAGLTQIAVADPGFTAEHFVAGAKAAFEAIVTAFAKGEREALRPLLNDTVFEHFSAAIKAREDAGQSRETTLVGIKSADVLEAQMDGRTAFVTVKFVSEQINLTRDKDGNVVEGDPGHVAEITDIWTFARNTRARDPNWALIETRSPH